MEAGKGCVCCVLFAVRGVLCEVVVCFVVFAVCVVCCLLWEVAVCCVLYEVAVCCVLREVYCVR